MHTIPHSVPATTAYKVLDSVYTKALIEEEWQAVRSLYSLMIEASTDLATYIADITVRQRQLVMGEDHNAEIHITQPLHQDEVLQLLRTISSTPLSLVVNHELIAMVGTLIKVHPDYFAGVRTIRLYSLILLLARQYDPEESANPYEVLAGIEPSKLYFTLQQVLEQKHLQFAKTASGLGYDGVDFNAKDAEMKDVDWFDWRVEQGMITKLPENLLAQLWDSLSHAEHIVFGDLQSNTSLNCQRTLNSMTPGEDTFALLIESLTYGIHPSWYKSLIFEALYAFMQFCKQHTNSTFTQDVNLPVLVSQAADDFARQHQIKHPDSSLSQGASVDEFAQLTPNKVNQYLRWSVSKLHSQQKLTTKDI